MSENKVTENKEEKPHFRGSIIAPLILLTIGIVFLLKNTNVLTGDAWDTILKLWPLIFVALGIDSILRRDGVAGPVFWIGLGTVIILSNFGVLAWSVWGLLLRMWPVLLIAIGLDIVLGRRRSIWGPLAAFVIIIAVLVGALLLVGVGTPTVDEQISWAPAGEVNQAVANLNPAVGDLTVAANPESGSILLDGALHKRQGEIVYQNDSIANGIGTITLRSEGVQAFLPDNNASWGWNLDFSPAVSWTLNADMGVGEINLDLTGLAIQELDVNMGVGEITVILPEKGDFSASISGAIGEMVILVPQELAVRIESDTGLANLNVPADFSNQDDTYLSPGYEAGAANQVLLDLSQAIGSISVRYK